MEWLEISLVVNGELAEAVAELLSRFAPNGVMTEQGVRYLEDSDVGTPGGPVIVRAYLPKDRSLEQQRVKIEDALHFMGLIQPLPAPLYRTVQNTNWMEAWKEHYKPIRVGERLMVVPVWLESPDPSRIDLKIDPGMAFGTGTHPSTQLCLEFIDAIFLEAAGIREHTPRTFIDIGCGSGILSIAALKLGAPAALAVDVDVEAIKNARENARVNGVEERLHLAVGSLKQVLAGLLPLRSAPLVAVNILAPVILTLLQEGLPQVLSPDGSILLAGILDSQEGEVVKGCRRAGLTVVDRRSIGDWIALRAVH